MEIKAGNFVLKSDRYCCWIEHEYTDGKGKLATKQITGYCTDFKKLLDDFLDRTIKSADVTSMEDAIKVIKQATEDAKSIAKAAYKGDFKIIRTKESK